MLSWVALHLAVAISALDGDESSRRELDINYSNQCKNLATKYGKKQRKRMKKYDRMHCPLEWLEDHCPVITNEVLLPNEQCPHIDQALETCIDGSHWDPMVGECATYTKEWKDLSKSERAAAGDLGLDQNTWMRGVSPSLNYGGSPTTPFSFLGCELYAKGTDFDGQKVNDLTGLKDKSIHSVAAAVAAGYTLTEAGEAGFEVKTACNAIVALYGDDGLYSLGMLWNKIADAGTKEALSFLGHTEYSWEAQGHRHMLKGWNNLSDKQKDALKAIRATDETDTRVYTQATWNAHRVNKRNYAGFGREYALCSPHAEQGAEPCADPTDSYAPAENAEYGGGPLDDHYWCDLDETQKALLIEAGFTRTTWDMMPENQIYWEEMTGDHKKLRDFAISLGYTMETWNKGFDHAYEKPFLFLTVRQRKAAYHIGWNQNIWDGKWDREITGCDAQNAGCTATTELDYMIQFKNKYWHEISAQDKTDLEILGYTQALWDGPAFYKEYDHLSDAEKAALETLNNNGNGNNICFDAEVCFYKAKWNNAWENSGDGKTRVMNMELKKLDWRTQILQEDKHDVTLDECGSPQSATWMVANGAACATIAARVTAAKTLGFTECTLAADGCAVTKAWKDLSAAEQRNTMCLLGVGERRWGRHVDKATDFHRNLVFTNDAVYDFHFRMGTSTQVAVDAYMARKHPPAPVPIGPETCQECVADLIKQCNGKFANGDSVGEAMFGYPNVDCEAAVNKNEILSQSTSPVGVVTARCKQCNFAQCSLDECSVLVV